MPRKKTSYTLAYVDTDGGIIYDSYESLDAVRDAIAAREDGGAKALLFGSEPIAFAVSTKPTVTIGAPRTRSRKKASPSPSARKPRATNSTTFDADTMQKSAPANPETQE